MDQFGLNDFLLLTSTIPVTLLAVVYLFVRWFSNVPRPLTQTERMFTDIRTGEKLKFPSINRRSRSSSSLVDKVPDEIYLSIVIPAYNERQRLPTMLEQTLVYLEKRHKRDEKFSFEIIIVDDGSSDGTATIAHEWAAERMRKVWTKMRGMEINDIRILKFERNRGKGGAVTQGIMCTRGKYILFADADGASNIDDLEQLEKALLKSEESGQLAVSIGSRAHLVSSEAVVKRSIIRNFLMYSFHTIVYLLSCPGVRSVADTQCGFKMFSRSAAQKIFPCMHVEGWIFDIEILHLASSKGIHVHEIPISWHEVEGSKMNLLKDSIKMAIELFVIRFNYATGRWNYASIKFQ